MPLSFGFGRGQILPKGQASGVSGPFSPSSLSGLVSWFSADSGVKDASGNLISTDDTKVGTWVDQSSNAKNLTSYGAAGASYVQYAPSWRSGANGINGNPAIQFNGSSVSQALYHYANYTLGPCTIFCVFKSSSTSGALYYNGENWNVPHTYVMMSGGDYTSNVRRTITPDIWSWKHTPPGWASDNIAHISCQRFNGTHASHSLRKDGILISTDHANNGVRGDPGIGTFTGHLAVGGRTIGGNVDTGMTGLVGEFIIYNRSLSDSDCELVEEYLRNKWATPTIAKDGLVTAIDAANYDSYIGSGTSWNDVSGNGKNLTLIGTTTFGSSQPKHISFGGGSYGRFNDNSTWDSIENFTTNVWINPANTTEGGIISHMGGLFEFFMWSGLFYVRCNGLTISSGSKTLTPAVNISTNTWSMLTLTYDGLNLKIYTNGTLYATGACVRQSKSTTTAPVIIAGAWEANPGVSAGYPLSGKISSVRIDNRALTSTEISSLYNWQKGYFGL